MLKKLVIAFMCMGGTVTVTAQSNPGQQLAWNIAGKMQDSLGLTAVQKAQVYNVNMQLHNQKQAARQQYAGNSPQLGPQLQQIEKTRDSLYEPILTPPQYNIYKQQKSVLIRSNQ